LDTPAEYTEIIEVPFIGNDGKFLSGLTIKGIKPRCSVHPPDMESVVDSEYGKFLSGFFIRKLKGGEPKRVTFQLFVFAT